VRYFPSAPGSRARLRGLLSTTLAIPILAGLVSVPLVSYTIAPAAFSGDADDLREKQKDVRSQIKDAEQQADEASDRVARATAALASSQSKLASVQADLQSVRQELYAARAQDAEMQARLVEAEGRLVRAQADVVTGRKALEAQREVVKDLIVTLYQQGDPTLVSLSGYFGAQEPSDLIRNEEFADSATEKQRGIFDDLTAAEILLRAREDEVEQARDDVAVRRQDAADNLAAIQTLTDQTEAAKQAVYGAIADNRARQAEARAARRADLKMLRELEREEARIKRQIMAAVAAAAAQANAPSFTGASDGFFTYPVNGRVTSPFGYRTHPIYGYYGLHDGTDFGAGCGAPLAAVADGRVVAAYYSTSYGNRLFVDLGKVNGDSIVVVYNHATSYRVGVGDRVARGSTVGYVGSTGWSTGCHLHFTVLRNGDAVDPMGYL
jgi:murein DD-endopeptidase MepM/ murein hydrolase activator NlpD